MANISEYLISIESSVKEALIKLNNLSGSLTLFVVNAKDELKGTLTDGDIRRGFIEGLTLDNKVEDFMSRNFHFLELNFSQEQLKEIKRLKIELVPFIDSEGKIIKVYDFTKLNSIIPVDVVIMAGGRGERLRPLTDTVPKPMLKVGQKPIIEHNIDHLISYGIENYHITVKYLAEHIIDYFGDGNSKNIRINYIHENKPLGTIGSVSLINDFKHDHILIMNSDLFTNINFDAFYTSFLEENADMAIATIPYVVNIPYAVLETESSKILSFNEKPTYTYYSNAGIYLIKRDLLKLIPIQEHFNATDLIQALLDANYKLIKYPILGYWVDIGKHEDYQKVIEIAKHLEHLSS